MNHRKKLKPTDYHTGGTIGRFRNGESGFFYAEAEIGKGRRVHAYAKGKEKTLRLLKDRCEKELSGKCQESVKKQK